MVRFFIMAKIIFSRTQKVQIELKRTPTDEELKILLGKNEDESMFDLPEDLIDFDAEEILEEDYSSNYHAYIPKAEVVL